MSRPGEMVRLRLWGRRQGLYRGLDRQRYVSPQPSMRDSVRRSGDRLADPEPMPIAMPGAQSRSRVSPGFAAIQQRPAAPQAGANDEPHAEGEDLLNDARCGRAYATSSSLRTRAVTASFTAS